jgi:hypothetical protein
LFVAIKSLADGGIMKRQAVKASFLWVYSYQIRTPVQVFNYYTRSVKKSHFHFYMLDDWGFKSQQELGIFLTTTSRLALRPTQLPIQWLPGVLSLG